HLDTKIAYYLTVSQEETKSFRLTDLAYEMTDMGGYDRPLEEWKENYIKEYKKEHGTKRLNEVDGADFNYEQVTKIEFLAPYASGDVDATLRIHNVLMDNINQSEQWKSMYLDFYPRLTVALAQMEANGFKADEEYMEVLEVEYADEKERLIDKIRANAF